MILAALGRRGLRRFQAAGPYHRKGHSEASIELFISGLSVDRARAVLVERELKEWLLIL